MTRRGLHMPAFLVSLRLQEISGAVLCNAFASSILICRSFVIAANSAGNCLKLLRNACSRTVLRLQVFLFPKSEIHASMKLFDENNAETKGIKTMYGEYSDT